MDIKNLSGEVNVSLLAELTAKENEVEKLKKENLLSRAIVDAQKKHLDYCVQNHRQDEKLDNDLRTLGYDPKEIGNRGQKLAMDLMAKEYEKEIEALKTRNEELEKELSKVEYVGDKLCGMADKRVDESKTRILVLEKMNAAQQTRINEGWEREKEKDAQIAAIKQRNEGLRATIRILLSGLRKGDPVTTGLLESLEEALSNDSPKSQEAAGE